MGAVLKQVAKAMSLDCKSAGGGKRAASPLPAFLFIPNSFPFSPSCLAFQGTQLSQGYMFTFKRAFFPPGSRADVLMAFAGFAFRGQGFQEEREFCARSVAGAHPLARNAIATRP